MTPLSNTCLVAAIGMVALAACTAPTTQQIAPKETGTPFPNDPQAWLAPLEYERALLETYFDQRSSAFDRGTDDGVAFLVEHNLAGLGATPESCKNRWFGQNPEEHVRELITPQWETLRRDPAWMMSVGPRAGQILGDDIFVIVVQQELTGDYFLSSSHQTRMHFQVLGNSVRNLVLCEPIKTVDIVSPGQDPILEDIPDVPQQGVPTYTPYPPGALPPYPQQPPQLPPLQPPVQQPSRPSAPIVLPPIQATGRPIVRPTSPQQPSQAPSPSPSSPPTPTTRPSTRPSESSPSNPNPSPTGTGVPSPRPTTPSTNPTTRPSSDPKPLPEAPSPGSGGGADTDGT
ncbi:hypothetical protein [Stomatohabitans albus]|uniref:hypothetical protein n=1 Tax=Stomatohabitans albus TaxID=3110766 RepID=UPI00300C8E3A